MLTEGGAYAFKRMQVGATATGNGNSMTPLTVNGGSYALLTAQVVGITSATITWEGTIDEENWVALPALNVATRAISATATADGIYRLVVTSLVAVRARISTYGSGTIYVYGLLTAAGEPGFGATGGGVTDHALLDNLDFASSGHTGFEAEGTAAAAIVTHVGESDPHTQYALESALGTMAAATETNYLLVDGSRTGATSQAQTLTNGIVSGKITSSVAADSVTFLHSAAGRMRLGVDADTQGVFSWNGGGMGVGWNLWVNAGSWQVGNSATGQSMLRAESGTFNFYARASGSGAPSSTMKVSPGGVVVGSNPGEQTAFGSLDVFTGAIYFRAASSTTNGRIQGRITPEWATSTEATRKGRLILHVDDAADRREGLRIESNGSAAMLGFYGGTAVAKAAAYTQTYSTADRTLSAYTADDESGAYSGIDNAQAGSVYAQLTDLNALRTATENLRAFVEDLAGVLNSHTDDLQALNLVG